MRRATGHRRQVIATRIFQEIEMVRANLAVDQTRALDRLMRFLSIEGVTGQEKRIGEAVVDELASAGIPRKAMSFDDACDRIPMPTQTGNVIVTMPGTRPGPRRLFSTHLDTVPLCAGARPVRKGKRIVAAGETALGGDNRTGVACLVTLAATLLEQALPHPPLTLLFTVREESGLWGARFVNREMLGAPVECFNVDGRSPADLILGAVGAERWEVEIIGRAAHAGVYPEKGVSATMVAALALADVSRRGWFGKVRRNRKEGTSNVGSVGGRNGGSAGAATNVVTDYALVRGETRSQDNKFARTITKAYRDAFRGAARRVRNDQGKSAKVKFRTRRDYYPFRLDRQSPVVQHAVAAMEALGLRPDPRTTNGGLDANWFVRHGIPTVTIGAGQNNVHSIGEYIELADFEAACRLLVALAM
jgi:tripeptide aminopeptidase